MDTLARTARMAAVTVTPVPATSWQPQPLPVVPTDGPVEVRTASGRVIGYVAASESAHWDAYRPTH